MGALSDKTVLLVTHQVDFLPVFDSILVCFHIITLRVDVHFFRKQVFITKMNLLVQLSR